MTDGGGGSEILKFCVTSFLNAPRGKSKTWYKGFLCAVQILVVIIIIEFDMVLGPSAEIEYYNCAERGNNEEGVYFDVLTW